MVKSREAISMLTFTEPFTEYIKGLLVYTRNAIVTNRYCTSAHTPLNFPSQLAKNFFHLLIGQCRLARSNLGDSLSKV